MKKNEQFLGLMKCHQTTCLTGSQEKKVKRYKGKPRPRPGDLIEIFRVGYEHWAIYVEDDCVVHLAPPSEDFEVGSITSVFSNRAVVKYSRLEDVLHGCSWTVNNKLDGTYLPLPVDRIIHRTKKMINKIVQYNLIEGNCEHFVNSLRYGVPRSQQVWPLAWLWLLVELSWAVPTPQSPEQPLLVLLCFLLCFCSYRPGWFRRHLPLHFPLKE
ncbi:Ca(2+)-independent N-acyltransferase isoform X2 [Heterocephalus glaber]|uniref:Ca(2+)-independent N-acyltransferase isoform X2 n=1 Tax=Heterocephalus glaber TaxID=10181 RepID=A0AAX6SG36_HETGA|nr:Ca(2+)-independent N-acyltransferase isoform X2 [Heterocephalus glaber]